jgi:hypothetical protein
LILIAGVLHNEGIFGVTGTMLRLNDVHSALPTRCVAQTNTPVFLRVEADSDEIKVSASQLCLAAASLLLDSKLKRQRIKITGQ